MHKFKSTPIEKFSYLFITISLLAVCLAPRTIYAQQGSQNSINYSGQMNDEADLKTFIEGFLEAFGNDEPDKIRAMMLPNANIAYFSTSNGEPKIFTVSADQFFSLREGKQNRKFQEPVRQYTVNISQGKLAFVRADATVYYDGKPSHHTNDFFILMKDNDAWKILSGSYTAQPLEKEN